MSKLNRLGEIISGYSSSVAFNMLEIGALPLGGVQEPFYQLLDIFPGSKISAIEVDDQLCKDLNEKARQDITYYATALGSKEEARTFYETNHPACSSLYKPNEKLTENYNNLEVARLKSTVIIDTVSLDYFVNNNAIGDVDFLKIDIQGAELDVFRGGINTLKGVVAIVSEAEFIELYVDQPLFGDVCEFLSKQEFMFHEFLEVGGRSLKPIVMNNNPSHVSQLMWSDAFFIKGLAMMSQQHTDKLLKTGVLAYLYGSLDVAFFYFSEFDKIEKTDLRNDFIKL